MCDAADPSSKNDLSNLIGVWICHPSTKKEQFSSDLRRFLGVGEEDAVVSLLQLLPPLGNCLKQCYSQRKQEFQTSFLYPVGEIVRGIVAKGIIQYDSQGNADLVTATIIGMPSDPLPPSSWIESHDIDFGLPEYLVRCMDDLRSGCWMIKIDGSHDPKNFLIHTTEQCRKILGLESPVYLAQLLKKLHSTDRANLLEYLNGAIRSQQPRKGEFRIVIDNQQRSFLVSMYPIPGNNGKIVALFGMLQDVSSMRHMERVLGDLNRYFRRIASDSQKIVFWTVSKEMVLNRPDADPFWDKVGLSNPAPFQQFLELVHSDDRQRVDARFREIVQTEKVCEVEYRVSFQGKIRYFSSIGYPLPKSPAEQYQVIGFTREITEEKRKDENLKKTATYLDEVLSCADHSIYFVDRDYNLLLVNRKMEELFGIRHPLEGQKCYHTVGRTGPCVNCPMTAIIHGEKQGRQSFCFQLKLPDHPMTLAEEKADHWSELVVYPIYDSTGQPTKFMNFARDITAQKRAELERDNALQELREAMNVGNMGQWTYDTETDVLHCSDLFCRIFGVDPKSPTLMDDIYQRIYPGDQPAFTFFRDPGYQGQPIKQTYRITRNGEIRYVRANALRAEHVEGRGAKIYGITQDVTDLIRHESLLQEKEQRFRLLFENSNDAIILMENGLVTECNDMTVDLFRLKNKLDVAGLTPYDFVPEFQPDGNPSRELATRHMEKARTGESLSFELQLKRADRSVFDSRIDIVTIPSTKEKSTLRQIFVRDITDQNNAARLAEDHRSFLALIADIRRSFYQLSDKEIFDEFLRSAVKHFKIDLMRSVEIVLLDDDPHLVFSDNRYFDYESGEFISELTDNHRVSDDCPCSKPIPFDQPTCDVFRALWEKKPTVFARGSLDDLMIPCFEYRSNNNIGSLFCLPIRMLAEFHMGVIFCCHREGAFSESVVNYLSNAAEELARIIREKRRWDEQQRNLQLAKESAESAAAVKSQFLANMSHEIRTPMTSILGFTEILLNDHLSVVHTPLIPKEITVGDCWDRLWNCKELTQTVQSNADFMLSLLNDILDFSKIDADKMQVDWTDVSIVDFLRDIVKLYSIQADKKIFCSPWMRRPCCRKRSGPIRFA